MGPEDRRVVCGGRRRSDRANGFIRIENMVSDTIDIKY